MSQYLLEAKNISHGFDTLLFHDVNFSLKPSQSAAIIGRSGCGKSTLLHILSTFIDPDEGSVTLLGRDLYSLEDKEIEALRRYDIGIIFQFHYLFKGMTALENIEVASMLSAEKIDDRLLEKLEIKDLMKQKIGELSGGQQQRVSIARVLSKSPRIIFADEPTGNLDNETAELVMDVLMDYIKETGAGLLLVTHDESMESRCDMAYKIEEKILKEKV
jgi:putative ABC transport system ATP-binding protein